MKYNHSTDNITPAMLHGFFVDWPNPPAPETHLKLLKNSDAVVLAIDTKKRIVVGFITAISDKILSCYIPFLEVLPEYQGKGIGQALVRKMFQKLKKSYMIDLLCDADLQGFYKRFGMQSSTGMFFRNYKNQSGKKSIF
ncbi:MAG: GNAT family N-acetyltransferase [Elusimicrobia bacterium RIFOXYA12_FULL_51_18]|nr:MAG: GNAT family N-acetyltransferase [Elusimicrobia bacterium RIFOXYA12_FULL_51_18]OGS32536.1 MAG: GNAT family N-acetyltransferase [Elusimicrobia bacterium RIFOXYA2_FULL_53_38]